jgi:hypothetical protein
MRSAEVEISILKITMADLARYRYAAALIDWGPLEELVLEAPDLLIPFNIITRYNNTLTLFSIYCPGHGDERNE